MEPIYEKHFHTRSYEVDLTGRVRPTAFLNYLLEAAGDHARLLGISVRDLMPRGLTWVLSRTHLKIFSVARSRDDILVRTWPSLREGRFTCREFEMFAANGSLLAAATCSFAVLDMETRRPVMLNDRLPHYPLLLRRAVDDPFATLPRLENARKELSFRVGTGDLDINRHANNVTYVKWALEGVSLHVVKECFLADLEVVYRAEVFHGQTVLSRCSELAGSDQPAFLHQLVRKEDGTELTRLITRWRKIGNDEPEGLPALS